MKTNRTLFEQIGGTYTQVGGFLLPDLEVEECEPIGKYGRMRKRYLKEHRPILFNTMLLSGTLYQHLSEIDCACKERIEQLTRQIAQREGVTEALKAANQFEWVQRMNSIHNRAEEIVLNELVYC
ncbi:MAG: TnpV protein [Oscillospiraceae bacterium]|nr:TnpV protein [Oscillospiraceae bacterium]